MAAPDSITPYRTDPATYAALSTANQEVPPTRGFIPFIDLLTAQITMAGDGALIAVTDGTFKAGVLYPISITKINYTGVLLLW